jgi:hypothetical protein
MALSNLNISITKSTKINPGTLGTGLKTATNFSGQYHPLTNGVSNKKMIMSQLGKK